MTSAPSVLSNSAIAAQSSPVPRQHEHQLRVLVVDDNSLNLSMLTRLLRKRFSHMLEDAPVAVDSGLKALQLLRENIYDVIMMDIQMPFLSGVDCTQRIRKGLDGVLPANRHATVIAVTTATGDEPEAVYRKNGFDGLIAKPVQYEAMSELLVPLLAAAREAAPKVSPVTVKGVEQTPALPITPLDGDRIFFLPTSPQNSSAAPDITRSSNFESLLNEQTRVSLQRYGACALARTGSIAGVPDRRVLRKYDDDRSNSGSVSGSSRESPTPSHQRARSYLKGLPTTADTRRRSSLTISQSGLNEQIRHEMEAAHLPAPALRSVVMAPTNSLDAYKWPSVTDSQEHSRQDEPLSPHDHFVFADGFSRLLSLRRPSLCPLAPNMPVSAVARRGSSPNDGSGLRSGTSFSAASSSSCDPSSSSSDRSSSLTNESASDASPLTTPMSEMQFDLSTFNDDADLISKTATGSYTPTTTSPLTTGDVDVDVDQRHLIKGGSVSSAVRDYSPVIDDDQRTLTDDTTKDSRRSWGSVLPVRKRPSLVRQNATPDLRT